jgi:hypothetical protein
MKRPGICGGVIWGDPLVNVRTFEEQLSWIETGRVGIATMNAALDSIDYQITTSNDPLTTVVFLKDPRDKRSL